MIHTPGIASPGEEKQIDALTNRLGKRMFPSNISPVVHKLAEILQGLSDFEEKTKLSFFIPPKLFQSMYGEVKFFGSTNFIHVSSRKKQAFTVSVYCSVEVTRGKNIAKKSIYINTVKYNTKKFRHFVHKIISGVAITPKYITPLSVEQLEKIANALEA